MPDQDRAVDMARRRFAAEMQVDPAAVQIGSVARERIPNPPLAPGEVSVGLVRYRYFVDVSVGNAGRRMRVEGNQVYDA